ncbi:multicopper oxidase-domain-containing protein [Zychaea mexicana]|uniref:multicopper oxidase-domain-containing protein n=1 Tax=Zychaea mexicana TaxID=64656 RepID=UPI0022FF04F0|nr:multicopper oxidase-domain-containing protein [Zychaea mexicana]KAI9491571.1 multicopper oxidase-domain-containing protein [Zychaea mexicana]
MRIVLVVALLTMFSAHQASAALRRFNLDISWGKINPDCFMQDLPAPVVNGQFPAPTLYALDGDEVEANVCNKMNDGTNTTIHFHGIKQYGTSYSDGVPYITQNPIKPGECFLYKFKVLNQSGTYYYHSHVGMQDDTVSGAFIVYPNEAARPDENNSNKKLRDGPYEYDEELMLYFNEWWHQPYYEREAYYYGPDYTLDLGSGSILMNGRSVHFPTMGLFKPDCPGFTVLQVEPGKTYRLRIIGGHTYQILGFAIAGHQLTIMEVDGQLTELYDTDYLELPAGQRISLLLKAHDETSDRKRYTIATNYRWHLRMPQYSNNGYAFIDYLANKALHSIVDPLRIPLLPLTSLPIPFPWPEMASINVPDLERRIFERKEADRTIIIKSVLNKMPDGRARFRINDSLPPIGDPVTPLLFGLLERFLPDMDIEAMSILADNGYYARNRTFHVKANEVVDVVFQDNSIGTFPCMTHAWHIHGHSHLLIARGEGLYDHEKHKDLRSYPKPILKDVSAVYGTAVIEKEKDSDYALEHGCGWTKVRIYTDNPGYWLVHCHITPHMLQGKWALLAESPDLIPSTLRYPAPEQYHPTVD